MKMYTKGFVISRRLSCVFLLKHSVCNVLVERKIAQALPSLMSKAYESRKPWSSYFRSSTVSLQVCSGLCPSLHWGHGHLAPKQATVTAEWTYDMRYLSTCPSTESTGSPAYRNWLINVWSQTWLSAFGEVVGNKLSNLPLSLWPEAANTDQMDLTVAEMPHSSFCFEPSYVLTIAQGFY